MVRTVSLSRVEKTVSTLSNRVHGCLDKSEAVRDQLAEKLYRRAENIGRFRKMHPDDVLLAIELTATRIRAAIQAGTWLMRPDQGRLATLPPRRDG